MVVKFWIKMSGLYADFQLHPKLSCQKKKKKKKKIRIKKIEKTDLIKFLLSKEMILAGVPQFK